MTDEQRRYGSRGMTDEERQKCCTELRTADELAFYWRKVAADEIERLAALAQSDAESDVDRDGIYDTDKDPPPPYPQSNVKPLAWLIGTEATTRNNVAEIYRARGIEPQPLFTAPPCSNECNRCYELAERSDARYEEKIERLDAENRKLKKSLHHILNARETDMGTAE